MIIMYTNYLDYQYIAIAYGKLSHVQFGSILLHRDFYFIVFTKVNTL